MLPVIHTYFRKELQEESTMWNPFCIKFGSRGFCLSGDVVAEVLGSTGELQYLFSGMPAEGYLLKTVHVALSIVSSYIVFKLHFSRDLFLSYYILIPFYVWTGYSKFCCLQLVGLVGDDNRLRCSPFPFTFLGNSL